VDDVGGDESRETSAQDYLRLLAREPDSLRFAEYADHLRGLGKLTDATTLCEYGLTRHPTYATGHVVMGAILLDAGMPDRGAAELRQALRLDPGHPRAHLMLGKLLLEKGDARSAIGEFEVALLYNPGLAEARARLAEIRGEILPPRSAPPSPEAMTGRKPGERPEWLTPARVGEVVGLAARDPRITRAAVADADGRMVATSAPTPPSAVEGEAMVAFVHDMRTLASRLGAGRLRSAVVAGERSRTVYLPLGDLVMAAAVEAGADTDGAINQLEDAVSADPQSSAEGTL
jgi:tetratricopeptide (TPR) repeat protein